MKNSISFGKLFSIILAFIFFGGISASYAQNDDALVIYEPAARNAVFTNQFVPEQMNIGQTYKVSFTVMNTGTETWNDPNLDQLPARYELISTPSRSTWSTGDILVSEIVAPGSSTTLNFTVTAPSIPGSYELQYQMSANGAPFGQTSKSVIVNVSKDGAGGVTFSDNFANYVSMDVPKSMTAGARYTVTVNMLNSGKTIWQPGYFWLEYSDPRANIQQNNTWGVTQAALQKEVNPGEIASFVFPVTAPSVSGSYTFNWLMSSKDGTFGESTPTMEIWVNSSQRNQGGTGINKPVKPNVRD